MSTLVTLKHVSDGRVTVHLSDDVLHDMADDPDPPVHLRIDGVEVELRTLPGGGASVSLELPREVARQLGLLPATRTDKQLGHGR